MSFVGGCAPPDLVNATPSGRQSARPIDIVSGVSHARVSSTPERRVDVHRRALPVGCSRAAVDRPVGGGTAVTNGPHEVTPSAVETPAKFHPRCTGRPPIHSLVAARAHTTALARRQPSAVRGRPRHGRLPPTGVVSTSSTPGCIGSPSIAWMRRVAAGDLVAAGQDAVERGRGMQQRQRRVAAPALAPLSQQRIVTGRAENQCDAPASGGDQVSDSDLYTLLGDAVRERGRTDLHPLRALGESWPLADAGARAPRGAR